MSSLLLAQGRQTTVAVTTVGGLAGRWDELEALLMADAAARAREATNEAALLRLEPQVEALASEAAALRAALEEARTSQAKAEAAMAVAVAAAAEATRAGHARAGAAEAAQEKAEAVAGAAEESVEVLAAQLET